MSDGYIVRLSEETEALFAKLRNFRERIENGEKPNRLAILRVAELMGERVGSAGIEAIESHISDTSDHLGSGTANAAMVARAVSGQLELQDERAALVYQVQLLQERIADIDCALGYIGDYTADVYEGVVEE